MNAPLPTEAVADDLEEQAIADLVATGQLPQAIAAATQALANPALAADRRMALLVLRFDCHDLRMETAQAGADVQAMLALARRPADAARRAQALVCESRLHRSRGDSAASLAAAQAALEAARRSGRPALVARGLQILGNARAAAGGDLPAALAHLQEAAAGFAALGDVKHRGRATSSAAGVLGALGRTAEADAAAAEALTLARQCNDLTGEG